MPPNVCVTATSRGAYHWLLRPCALLCNQIFARIQLQQRTERRATSTFMMEHPTILHEMISQGASIYTNKNVKDFLNPEERGGQV